METIFKPNFAAISPSWGRRAIVPSSFKISTRAPPGFKPAILVISSVASVCPLRSKTPFSAPYRGKTCQGRANSEGFRFPATKAFIVDERSKAETPVVQPYPLKSTDIVNGVPSNEVFYSAIGARQSSSQRERGRGAHNNPLP